MSLLMYKVCVCVLTIQTLYVRFERISLKHGCRTCRFLVGRVSWRGVYERL